MTPKEKADELVHKMYAVMSGSVSEVTKSFAKKCAIVAVDDILNCDLLYPQAKKDILWGLKPNRTELEYWFEVKKEIEKI